jgi:hypothetical protein
MSGTNLIERSPLFDLIHTYTTTPVINENVAGTTQTVRQAFSESPSKMALKSG